MRTRRPAPDAVPPPTELQHRASRCWIPSAVRFAGAGFAAAITLAASATAAAGANAPPVINAPGNQVYEQGETISPVSIGVSDPDGDTLVVTVTNLPPGLSFVTGQVQGTVAGGAAAQDYSVTIKADDRVNAPVTAAFTITVTAAAPPPNAPPEISAPDNRAYDQGEPITPFGITVTDPDGDPVAVSVSGLPDGLSFSSGQVQGTVSADAAARDYAVTIRADDRVNTPVTAAFTITVTAVAPPPNAQPVITVPGDKTYEQGETISPFSIDASDPDSDPVEVTVSGLPPGLSFSGGQVQGTVSADAAARDYAVTIRADDRVNTPVTAAFTITVTARKQTPPTVTISGPTVPQRGAFNVRIAFSEAVTGFEQGDVTVGNGFVREFSGSGARYVANIRITPGFSGTVTVDVAANVAADAEGDPNVAASRFSVEGDQTRPTVAISGPTELQNGVFDVTFTFSESMTGFEQEDVTVGNGSVTAFSGSGLSYTATITPAGAGTVTVDVAAHVATDATGNPNMPARRYSVQAEAPSNAPPVIAAPDDKTYEQGDAITPFGITVTDTDGDPVTVTVTGLPSGLSYASDQVQGTVAADAAAQAYTVAISADDRVNPAVTVTFTITVTAREGKEPSTVQGAPTVIISGPTAPQRGAFRVTVVFSEPVTGFEEADLTVGNGFARKFTGSGTNYSSEIRITPGFSGTVTVDVAANVAVDANGDGNRAATRYSVEGDQTRPTVAISGPTELQNGVFDVTFTFSESMTGFEQEDVTVGNGSVTAFSGSGLSYTATITPAGAGTVTVDVAAHVATDATGNPNMPARRYSVQAEAPSNAPPVITAPGDRTYEQGDAIAPFGITVTDADGDPVTVTVTGLPSGLSYASDQVQGTVAADAAAQSYTVTISADDGVNPAVTVTFTITVTGPNAATANSPPVITNPGDHIFRRGETITPFGITVTDADNDTVTVIVTNLPSGLSYANGQVLGTVADHAQPGDHTVTILADDGGNAVPIETFTITVAARTARSTVNPPTVSISGPTASQGESFDVTITFSVSVTGFVKGDVTVGNGTATALSGSGSSYTATITPTASGTITVDVAADVAVDGAGNGNTAASQFSVSAVLSRPTVVISGPTSVQAGAFTVSITFSEAVTGFAQADVTVGNGRVTGWAETNGNAAVIITPAASGTVTVDVAANVAVDADNNGNTAAVRYSVEANAGEPTVTISCPTGVQTGAFTVDIDFSESVTGFEQADVTVGNGRVTGWAETGGNALVIITPAASGTVTVDVPANVATDSDGYGNLAAPQCSVQVQLIPRLTIADASASEGNPITFTVTLDRAVSGGLTVTPSFSNGGLTTEGWATQGADYTANTAALSFAGTAGEKKTFTVATTEDTSIEGNERFTVGLTVSGTSATVTATDTATGTIINDDECSQCWWTIRVGGGATQYTAQTLGVEEGSTVELILTQKVEGQRTLTYSTVQPTAHNGSADPATAFVDYKHFLKFGPVRYTVEFSGRGDSKTIRIPTYEDTLVERDEYFRLNLTSNYENTGYADNRLIYIKNDDQATITVSDARVSEGGSMEFTATLDKALAHSATVTPSFTHGTATGDDYTANTSPITFAGTSGEKKTLTIQTTEDTAPEETETFTVGLALSQSLPWWWYTGEGDGIAVVAGTGTIADDDAPALTIADASASEGDALTFTVTLDSAVPGGLKATPNFTDITATKGSDYTANTAALSFAGTAGETKTFTVATTEDSDIENDETFTIGLTVSGTSKAVTATDTATGTIADDERLPAVTINDANGSEGGAMTFTVTLDSAVSGGLTVTPSFTDVTATKGTDYTENTAALTFAGTAGETKTIRVLITDDKESEAPEETFTVSLTVSGTSERVTATDTGMGTIFDDEPPDNSIKPAVTIADASAAEGETLTFTMTLDYRVSGGFKVTPTYTNTDDTATKGTDYTANTAALTFAGTAGETQTFTVATTEDAEAELDETFTIGLVVSDTLQNIEATDTATGTITNDDGAVPALTIANASAAEGDQITFTVTLDEAVSGGLTVTPSFADVTATKGTDYVENTAALNFAGTAGETKTFTVATTEDAQPELDETFTVGLAVSGTSETVTTSTGTGTITNDDGAVPALTIADASAAEGDQITFTVTLDKAVTGGLTVTTNFTDVTATKGTDYTENTAGIGFAGTAGEAKTFTVATTEDADQEPDETFTIGLTVSGTSLTVQATDTATGTINDDDAPPAVTIADASAAEGDSLTFTVTLDKAVPGGLTATPSFAGGTATKGTDYTANTAGIGFAGTAGETKTFTVATTEDEVVEVNETFSVSLAVSGTSATVTAADTATGTITNDDTATVTVADVSNAEGGPGFSFVVDGVLFTEVSTTATLDKAVQGGFQLHFYASAGTATKDPDGASYTTTDFGANAVSLSFDGNAGERQSLDQNWVSIYQDEVVEGTETFNISYSLGPLPGAGPTLPPVPDGVRVDGPATGTIIDDDTATVTIADASATEGDAILFTATLDRAVAGGFTVTPSFGGGTATEGTDYTGNTTALVFAGAAGETQTFTVATAEDADTESNETFTVSLSLSGTSLAVAATDTATGTVIDDDGATTVTVTDASADEGDSLTFTVTLNQAVSGGLTVTPSFGDGTATKGTDYTENTAALSFAGNAGETKTFSVATTEDTDKEADETFTVGLAVSGTQATVAATDTATGTIVDDDGAAVLIGNAWAQEGDGITFSVVLTKPVPGGLTVTPDFTDGTATEGVDYTENTAPLAFAGTAGEIQTFTVATTEDTDIEPNETFTVGVSVSGTSETVMASATATGTILDDDGAAVLIGNAWAQEGNQIAFAVVLTKSVSGGLTATPSFTDDTATEGTDYTENTAALTFAGTAGEIRTFTVATSEDSATEPDETFTVGLAVSGTSETVTATATATGTILDDDAPTLTIADASAAEGDAILFTATLDKAVVGGFTVTPSFTDGTATEGADYTENTTALTFAGNAGEAQTFSVATTEDTDQEDDETFTVSLTVSGTAATVTAGLTATGTITDDDGQQSRNPPALTIVDASATEGEAITFTVTLDKAVSGGLTVMPRFEDVTATSGTDYTENTAGLAFAGTAGERHTFTVATAEDTDLEADETFTVSLAVSGTQATVTATDTATGTIRDDDAPAVTIDDASANEGEAITFTVTLDRAVSDGLTVTPSFTDGTATKGTDYTENTAGLAFAGTAGETKTFTVATTEDTDEEPAETFTVSLTVSGTQATVRATDTATGTIHSELVKSPAPVNPTVTIEDASAGEGDSMIFAIALDQAVAGGLTVTPRFTDGSATKGTDYTENTAGIRFVGAAGETQTFTVATTEDAAEEQDETFIVSLAVSRTSATVTATDTATGRILDDDGPPRVTITDASASEGDRITFAVTLNQAVAGGLTVTPGFTDGTATEGADYTRNTNAIAFAGTKGETRTFSVATTEDSVAEDDETFIVSLAVSGTSATVTATDTATGRILDDDATAMLTIDDAAAIEGDDLTFTVTLDNRIPGGFTATPSFTDVTATSGLDYRENAEALHFTGNAGETRTLTIPTVEDSIEESDEVFTVWLTVADTPATVTANEAGTGRILGDGTTPTRKSGDAGTGDGGATATLTIDDVGAVEGDDLTFTVTLHKHIPGGLTVTPSFTDVTATSGVDYRENAAALHFIGAAGETRTLTVPTIEDAIDESDEVFTVWLAVSNAPTTVTADQAGTGRIFDDDAKAALTIGDAVAVEGDDLTFRVTLDKRIPRGFTVTPRFTDGTATKGTDYRENTAVLRFTGTPGETRTLTVPTIENAIEESDKVFMVWLTVADTPATVTADGAGTGRILDDDTTATLTIGDAAAAEGDDLAFTVTLDKRVLGGFTVTPSFNDVTATSVLDYHEDAAALRFSGTAGETRTLTIPTIEDTIEESDEVFTVWLAVADTPATVTANEAGTGRILDDDLTPIVLRAEAARVAETAGPTTITVTAALDGGVILSEATAVTVTVGTVDDAAVEGTDYKVSSALFTVTIPPGSAEGSSTFTLEPVNDTLMEPDESLAVNGNSASRHVTGTAVTLLDDDAAAAHLVVSMEPDVVPENGGPTRVTVIAEIVGATAGVALPVTMTVGDTEDTAEMAVDYESVEAFAVTIPAGSSRGRATFVLSPIEDDLLEGNERLTVRGNTLQLEAALDHGVIQDEELAEARAEGTGRTLFLLARAIGSESLAAIEERFSGRRTGRAARLGALSALGSGGGDRPDWATSMRVRGGRNPGETPYGLDDPGSGLQRPGAHSHGRLGWLDGSNFVAPLNGGQPADGAAEDGGDAGWVLWGRAGTTQTTVQPSPGTEARGDLFTMHLGADTRLGSEMLLGLALSHSRGKLGYTLGENPEAAPAAVEGGVSSIQPYAHWAPRSGLEVWGLAGLGRGALEVSDEFGQVDAGVGMRLAAAGARHELGAESGLALKADVFHAALKSDAQPDLPAAHADAIRARMLVEWQSDWAFSESTQVRPRLEVGARWDGGTDVAGFGSEVGGGVSVVNIRRKLELAVAGRYLVAHQEDGFDEWGASVVLRGGPGVEGRGPWVSLEPEWGAAGSQVQSLVGPQADPGYRGAGAADRVTGVQPGRSRLAVGYSLPEMGAEFRMEALREALGLETEPKHGVRLSASISW